MAKYDPSRRCKACGQMTGDRRHKCASVDRKKRRCIDCNKRLNNDPKSERYRIRCAKCGKKRWRANERAERIQIKEAFGGRCSRCGYDNNYAALHFHHKNGRSDGHGSGHVRIKELRDHPKRFELLCANCHLDEHNPGSRKIAALKVAA